MFAENRKQLIALGTQRFQNRFGFGKAAELARLNLDSHIKKVSELRDYMVDQILKRIPDTYYNGDKVNRHPGNANITFEYIEGEAMLILLDQKGICVSTGSACSSKSLKPSHVLSAIGIPVERIHGSLRLTVGDFTTKEDVDYVVDSLEEIVSKLRSISSVNTQKGW